MKPINRPIRTPRWVRTLRPNFQVVVGVVLLPRQHFAGRYQVRRLKGVNGSLNIDGELPLGSLQWRLVLDLKQVWRLTNDHPNRSLDSELSRRVVVAHNDDFVERDVHQCVTSPRGETFTWLASVDSQPIWF